MAAVILILKLCLFINFGFTESSEDHTSPELNLDLECINDFLTEMKCHLTPDQRDSCSEYSLTASIDTFNNSAQQFECEFGYFPCECTLYIISGFILNESFEIDVMRNKNVLLTKNIGTTNTIKPKRPRIVSVNKTQNGNFLIFWDTEYRSHEPEIDDNLSVQLIYYVKGRKESIETVNLTNIQKPYELIGRKLESTSEYIVEARVKYHLSPHFSDYSDSYTFKTPMSLQDTLKILIPIICLTLICIIITVYTMVLAEWGQKIPTPKISTGFGKQVPHLVMFHVDFSPVHLDSSKLVHAGEKICTETSLADNLGKDGNSDCGQIQMSSKYYKILKTSSDDCNVEREHGNSSGISNKSYMFSFFDKFHNSALRNGISDFNENEIVVPATMIQVDFEYAPCTGCSESENITSSITVVPGYQSINELDCTPADQAFISSRNDANLIMDKLIFSKNSQKIASESTILAVDSGYKDFQSLLRNSSEQQILITEPEL